MSRRFSEPRMSHSATSSTTLTVQEVQRCLSTLEVDRSNLDLLRLEYEKVVDLFSRLNRRKPKVIVIRAID